jgi:hypothetical protein
LFRVASWMASFATTAGSFSYPFSNIGICTKCCHVSIWYKLVLSFKTVGGKHILGTITRQNSRTDILPIGEVEEVVYTHELMRTYFTATRTNNKLQNKISSQLVFLKM